MGQFYLVFNLDRNERYRITHGHKMMEHAYIGHDQVNLVELVLLPGEQWHKQRIVWAGDYAPAEEGEDYNLYAHPNVNEVNITFKEQIQPRYIINHDKKLFIDKKHFIDKHNKHKDQIHPLVLLTAEGCGRGMGDYGGKDEDNLIGLWARDRISTSFAKPSKKYSELHISLTCDEFKLL